MRDFKRIRCSAGLVVLCLSSLFHLSAADRPNILWITAEDMSPALGCYGDAFATTPHIDQLATESVRYTRAFATSPVCSTARCCLITGCYPTTLGTHNMRSAFPLPEHVRGFPQLLRDVGYYTTNNEKTDYNTADAAQIIRQAWTESSNVAHWRARPDRSQPFFSVFNLMDSHQSRSMVWSTEKFVKDIQSQLEPHEIHDPAAVQLPAYYPESAIIRRELARFYDCVTLVDKQVGHILQQLEDDGLAEETIVFFFSDHGSGIPRHKRLLLDSGMHVPLLIRFPKKFQHLAEGPRGSINERLVSFVDFAPSVLALAGIEPPAHLAGTAFLGLQRRPAPEFVYGHRDRVDEVFDLARSVRSSRYLYIRNYMPHLSYNQPTGWPDQGEIRHEFYRLASRETMNDSQWHFAGPNRRVEELFDCQVDPLNLNNRVDSAAHAAVLDQMRAALRQQILSQVDRGFVPEAASWQLVGRSNQADKFLSAYESAEKLGRADQSEYRRLLASTSGYDRYWGAIAMLSAGELSQNSLQALQLALSDDSPEVRIEAAHALSRAGRSETAIPVLIKLLYVQDLNVVLRAMRTIELLGTLAAAARPDVEAVAALHKSVLPTATTATFVVTPEQDLAMFIGFSATAFLSRLASCP